VIVLDETLCVWEWENERYEREREISYITEKRVRKANSYEISYITEKRVRKANRGD
jgi:hypothetical protein